MTATALTGGPTRRQTYTDAELLLSDLELLAASGDRVRLIVIMREGDAGTDQGCMSAQAAILAVRVARDMVRSLTGNQVHRFLLDVAL